MANDALMEIEPEQFEQAIRAAGFLAPECGALSALWRQNSLGMWFDGAYRLNRHAMSQYQAASELLPGKSLTDPLALGIQMFPRCFGSFQSCIILAERGAGLEAQSHVRAIYETAFWMGYLITEPNKAVAALQRRGDKDRRRQLERILAIGDFVDAGIRAEARQQLKDMGREPPRVRELEIFEVAKAGGLADHYLHYNDLSHTAAHVSLASIFGYLSRDEGGVNGHQIGPDGAAIAKAVKLGCHAMLAACQALEALTGRLQSDEVIAELNKVFSALDDIED